MLASLRKAAELAARLSSAGQFAAFAQRQADLLFHGQCFGQAVAELKEALPQLETEARAVAELLLAYGLLRAGQVLEFRVLWPQLDHSFLAASANAGLRRLHRGLEALWRRNRESIAVVERLEQQARQEDFQVKATVAELAGLLAPIDSLKACEYSLRGLALDPQDAELRRLFAQAVGRVPDKKLRTRLCAQLSQTLS